RTKSGKACVVSDEWQAARDAIEKDNERRRAIDDYTDATLGDGFENAEKVAKVASKIPGPWGRVFKALELGFKYGHEAYEVSKLLKELIFDLNQTEAVGKGTKELAKKGEDIFTERATKSLDKILKRKGITIPEPIKKEIVKRARKYFDEHVRDPLIEKEKKEF